MGFNVNTLRPLEGAGRKLFIETYGCQMNVGDTEIVVSLMQREGYVYTDRIGEADVILINTCSIRDNAEQRIWGRLAEMKRYRRANPGLVVDLSYHLQPTKLRMQEHIHLTLITQIIYGCWIILTTT